MSAGNEPRPPPVSRPEAFTDAWRGMLTEVELTSPDGCAVLRAVRDAAGTLVDFEWVFLNAASAPLASLVGMPMVGQRFLERFSSPLAQMHFAVFRQVVETGQPCIQEVVLRESMWLRLAMHRFADGLVLRAQDITPSKHAERERDARLLLEQVGRRDAEALARQQAVELDTARVRLARTEKLSMAGQLAASVGHEINNPLAFVLGNLQVVLEQLAGVARDGEPAQAERLREPLRALEDARRGAERIRSIVRDLRTLSRVEDSELSAVDVHAALEFSLTMAMPQVRHRARVERRYGAVPRVLAHEGRLGQVFLNLLVNAAQAMPDGQAAEHCITLTSWREGARVVVEVRDNGQGMTPEVLGRVFEPFFTTKKARGEGLGLGLSICLGLVHGMQGDLKAESEPGRGSVFRVSLGVCEDVSVLARESARTVADVQARKRVLVIDDEPAIGTVLRRILGRLHDVVVLRSGGEALALLAQDDAFDLVLCDLMMVEMSGMELHERLAPTHGELLSRFVYMTGGSFTPRAHEFLKTVPARRIDKPFEADVIRALVAQAPSRRV
jgi:two-component system, NtrC family, sensor kinase